MRKISIINLKGGVGKTITAVNMASILAKDFGQNVLVIDADPQANATRFYGLGQDVNTVAGILDGLCDDYDDFIYDTRQPGVWCVPASIELIQADIASTISGGRTKRLAGFLGAIEEDAAAMDGYEGFDMAIFDCPPSFTAASVAAIAASDDIIIPVKVDAFALDGLTELSRQIEAVREIRPEIRVAGILITMWHNSPAVVQGETLLRQSGFPVFRSVIRRSDKVDESTFAGQPLDEYSRYSSAGIDYRSFVSEYMEGKF